MTLEQKQVKDWMLAFGQECPEKPTIPSLEVRKLRAKLHLEECLESIRALGLQVILSDNLDCQKYPVDIGLQSIEFIETPHTLNLKEIADGCEDLKVVTEGTLVACGLCQPPKRMSIDELDKIINEPNNPRVAVNKANADPLFDEVMRSNNAKLWSNSEISAYFGCRVLDNLQVACKEGGYFAKRINENQWLVKDSDGKVIKPISFTALNLQVIIEEMSK